MLSVLLRPKPMNSGEIALGNQLGFCIQPMLYVAPERGTLVHIGKVRLSGHLIWRRRKIGLI